MFLNRLPFDALLFCLPAFEFYFSFPKMMSFFFFYFVRFTYVNTEHYSKYYFFTSGIICSRSWVCVSVSDSMYAYLCVQKNFVVVEQSFGSYTLPSHTMTTCCTITLCTDRHTTRKSIHAYVLICTHTSTLGNDLLPCVCCLHSCCFSRFVRFHGANRCTTTCTQTNEQTTEYAHTHECVFVCSVHGVQYYCQFSCPFHSLMVRMNNICALLRSKYKYLCNDHLCTVLVCVHTYVSEYRCM